MFPDVFSSSALQPTVSRSLHWQSTSVSGDDLNEPMALQRSSTPNVLLIDPSLWTALAISTCGSRVFSCTGGSVQ